jgi:hypothetical protein
MQKESDAVAVPTAAQRFCDRYEMVVMNPDQIIFLDNLFELGGEMIIDFEIPTEISVRILGKI